MMDINAPRLDVPDELDFDQLSQEATLIDIELSLEFILFLSLALSPLPPPPPSPLSSLYILEVFPWCFL